MQRLTNAIDATGGAGGVLHFHPMPHLAAGLMTDPWLLRGSDRAVVPPRICLG